MDVLRDLVRPLAAVTCPVGNHVLGVVAEQFDGEAGIGEHPGEGTAVAARFLASEALSDGIAQWHDLNAVAHISSSYRTG